MGLRANKLLIVALLLSVAMLHSAIGKSGKKGPKKIAPEDTVLAIYSVEPMGVDASLARALTPHLIMVINKYRGEVRIVQSDAVDKALELVGLANSGACTDTECLPGLGEILGANRFLVTNLSKLKTYTLYASVYDAESGALMFTEFEKGTASEDDLPVFLERLASRIMARLNGKKVKKTELPEPPPPPPPDIQPIPPGGEDPPVRAGLKPGPTGSLYITTTPKGAQVYVDAELKGKTPVHIKGLEAGDHDIMITRKGYAPLTKTVTVAANKRTDIVERMSAQKGKLTIKSTPPGAMAYLDGKYIGKTPVELPGILIGEHKVKIQKKNYTSKEETVSVEVGGDAQVYVSLKGLPGKILIASQPEGAKVFIDGKEVGTTTYSGKIASGKHKVRVSKKGYKSKEEDVDIAPNRAKQLSWTLEKGPESCDFSKNKLANPLKNGVLTRKFGMYKGRPLEHIDLSRPSGTPITAAEDGVVIYSGKQGGWGMLIIIEHKGYLKTLYAHNRKNLVKKGDIVKRGQKIGEVGTTGIATGPVLSFQVLCGEKAVDPLLYLEKKDARLGPDING